MEIFDLFLYPWNCIFYIIQSFNYYGKNRAYPEAKAYKIVSDISVFFSETFVASRNLYFKPQGLKFIEPYEEWQTYLLNKAFKYIPQNDGERAIWKYEYLYANYIRARTAPIDFEKLDEVNLKALINIGDILHYINLLHRIWLKIYLLC